MRVLLVEDDLDSSRGIALLLRSEGSVVDTIESGEEALELISYYDYDIIILDLMLPDIEGFEVVRRMRACRLEVPVLILSALSRPQIKVKGFRLGADDFISKPFDKMELVARAQAIIRRNLESKELVIDSNLVHLTGKEYAILELLVLRKGIVLSKETFLNHLYGGMDEPEIKIIDVFVCKLQKKLVYYAIVGLISTIWGRGYMMREILGRHITENTMKLHSKA